MITIQALEGGYGESPVLRGVALDVPRGEIFAILGRVLYCILNGECKFRRRHADYDPIEVAISGDSPTGRSKLIG